MSEKNKKTKPKAVSHAPKEKIVRITLPDNPTRDDIVKATKEVIDKTDWLAIDGCNDLIAEVDVRLFHVDMTYQRGLGKIGIREGEFDKSKCDPVWASYRDGLLNLVDGQRRVHCAKRDHVAYVPTKLMNGFAGLTQKEEAKRFYEQNDGKVNLSALDNHKTALVFEEPIHTMLQKYCDSYGLVIGKKGVKTGFWFNCLSEACKALEDLKNKGGEEAMDAFLRWVFGIYEKSGWIRDEQIATATTAKFFNAFAMMYRLERSRVTSVRYDAGRDVPPKFDKYSENLAMTLRQMLPKNLELYVTSYKTKMDQMGIKCGDERPVMKKTLTEIAEGELTANMVLHLQFNL